MPNTIGLAAIFIGIAVVTTSETAEKIITRINQLDPMIVALWTIGPGALAGLARQLNSDPLPTRKFAGEMIASMIAAFGAGAGIMHWRTDDASIWTLFIAGASAGWAGAQLIHFVTELLENGLGDWIRRWIR